MKGKCNCNCGMGILALILAVIGLYSIILGIKTQLISPILYSNWVAMLYYLIGIAIMALAKMSKWKAYGQCDSHKMK